MKSAPNSASAAEAATSFSIVHVMATLPLSLIFSPLRGTLPRKKYPPSLLLPRYAVSYESSEWMLSTISDALNWMIAFGLVCIYCKRCWIRCIVRSVGLACSAVMALWDQVDSHSHIFESVKRRHEIIFLNICTCILSSWRTDYTVTQ